MLKSLAMLGMLILLQGAPLQQAQPSSHSPSAQSQQKAEPTPPVVVKVDNHVSCDECDKKDSAPRQDPDKWAKRGFWINLALALVIAGISYLQARAALLGAQGIIRSERPWMIPHITQPDDDDVMSAAERPEGWSLPIEIKFKNLGKTPAIAISGKAQYYSETIKDRTKEKAPTLVLDLGKPPRNEQGEEYVPGAIYVPMAEIPSYLEIPKKFLIEEKAAWESGAKCLCIRGLFVYEDVFGKRHTTRFCYVYQDITEIRRARNRMELNIPRPREFRKARPVAYNKID